MWNYLEWKKLNFWNNFKGNKVFFYIYEYVEYLVQVTGAINFIMQKQNAQEKMLANIIKIKK